MRTIPAMHCEHANEVPQTCPCPPNCYCKNHTCRIPKKIRQASDETLDRLQFVSGTPKEGIKTGIYEHYKGGFYQVLGVGAHADTEELLVVYIALAIRPGPRMRVRPLATFEDMIEWPSGEMKPRFLYRGTEIPPPTP